MDSPLRRPIGGAQGPKQAGPTSKLDTHGTPIWTDRPELDIHCIHIPTQIVDTGHPTPTYSNPFGPILDIQDRQRVKSGHLLHSVSVRSTGTGNRNWTSIAAQPKRQAGVPAPAV